MNPRTNALAGRPLTLPFSPSVLSARDLALWVGSDVPPQRRARVDTQTGDLRRDFRPPRDPVAVAAGDDGAAWFAQGEEVPFGRVPVEGDYLDLDADSEGDGSLDVAVGPRGAVYVLLDTDTYTDNDTGNEGSRTVSFRPLVRVDPRTGDVISRARVGDEARALAAGAPNRARTVRSAVPRRTPRPSASSITFRFCARFSSWPVSTTKPPYTRHPPMVVAAITPKTRSSTLRMLGEPEPAAAGGRPGGGGGG